MHIAVDTITFVQRGQEVPPFMSIDSSDENYKRKKGYELFVNPDKPPWLYTLVMNTAQASIGVPLVHVKNVIVLGTIAALQGVPQTGAAHFDRRVHMFMHTTLVRLLDIATSSFQS